MRPIALLLLTAAALCGADTAFPPHRIAGNLYYVGSQELASYLITTPQGHVLINTSFEETVPLIKASVEKLGFHFTDIRILLVSHAHSDHCASLATVKKMTGAKLFVMRGDAEVVAAGGKGAIQNDEHYTPVIVDRVLSDGDKVQLGNMTLTAHLTPGHTKGCTTWTMTASDKGNSYHVVIVGSPNVNPGYLLTNNPRYPNIATDYEHTFSVLKSLPCDIFLGAHGSYYDMDQKYKQIGSAERNPFVDPVGYQQYVQDREAAFEKKLHP